MCNIRIFVDFVFSCLDCFNRRGLLTVYSEMHNEKVSEAAT